MRFTFVFYVYNFLKFIYFSFCDKMACSGGTATCLRRRSSNVFFFCIAECSLSFNVSTEETSLERLLLIFAERSALFVSQSPARVIQTAEWILAQIVHLKCIRLGYVRSSLPIQMHALCEYHRPTVDSRPRKPSLSANSRARSAAPPLGQRSPQADCSGNNTFLFRISTFLQCIAAARAK